MSLGLNLDHRTKISDNCGSIYLKKALLFIFNAYRYADLSQLIFYAYSFRFPFDMQTCSILLFFAEYEEKEVSWKSDGWIVNMDSDRDMFGKWQSVSNIMNVSTYIDSKNISGRIIDQAKSLFNFTIVLKRNPTKTIIYVIFPTGLITIFNIISALLPTGQGFPEKLT